jgi:hypothetical protein
MEHEMSADPLDRAARRAAVLPPLRQALSDCYLLYALLPRPVGWHGLAEGAFELRVDGLHARIEAAVTALNRAEDEL